MYITDKGARDREEEWGRWREKEGEEGRRREKEGERDRERKRMGRGNRGRERAERWREGGKEETSVSITGFGLFLFFSFEFGVYVSLAGNSRISLGWPASDPQGSHLSLPAEEKVPSVHHHGWLT